MRRKGGEGAKERGSEGGTSCIKCSWSFGRCDRHGVDRHAVDRHAVDGACQRRKLLLEGIIECELTFDAAVTLSEVVRQLFRRLLPMSSAATVVVCGG